MSQPFRFQRHIECVSTELLLEKALRKEKLAFEHSASVGCYEVDFIVHPYVAVEVDGYFHCQRDVLAKDKGKTLSLEREGYVVIHVWGDEVRYDIRHCIRRIRQAVEQQKRNCRLLGRPQQNLASWQLQLLNSCLKA